MTDRDQPAIRIVDDDLGVGAVGFLGSGAPVLLAHRPEPWRFSRLSSIVKAANDIALTELGEAGANRFAIALVAIADLKGDFTAVWRRAHHLSVFETFVARAIKNAGENPEDQLGHEFEDAPSGMDDWLSRS